MTPEPLSFPIPTQLLDLIVERVTDQVLERVQAEPESGAPPSPFMTVVEAAEFLRCSRQRIDDLLSQRRLTRHKDGARTLIRRAGCTVGTVFRPDLRTSRIARARGRVLRVVSQSPKPRTARALNARVTLRLAYVTPKRSSSSG